MGSISTLIYTSGLILCSPFDRDVRYSFQMPSSFNQVILYRFYGDIHHGSDKQWIKTSLRYGIIILQPETNLHANGMI